MVSQRERTGLPGWSTGDEAEELLKWANPNPERVGCPAPEVLIELARRERPPSDESYKHLGRCSPCYRRVRELQAAAAAAGAAPRKQSTRMAALLFAAAVVVLMALGTWAWFQRQGAPPGAEVSSQRAQLDLREYTVSRSERQEPAAKPVVLARRLLKLKVILPIGSQPGMYDLQLFNVDLNPVAVAGGEGRIENYLTTVETTLDLVQVPSGQYQLALRRQGEEWRWFPAVVQ